MRTKYASLALVPVALILQLGAAVAAPAGGREVGVRWDGLEARTSKIVVHNLSDRPAQASLKSAEGAREAVALPANGAAEVSAAALGRLGDGDLRLKSAADLLVLQVPESFDAAATVIEKAPAARISRPAGRTVTHGATGAAEVTSKDAAAQVEVAVHFLAAQTSVLIRQLDAQGNEVTSLVATASRPIGWRTTLGAVGGSSRIELQTLAGEAEGSATVKAGLDKSAKAQPSPILPPPTAASGGLAQYSPEINWSGNLNYYITSGPVSLCGDLHISRNFAAYTTTAGWICTDASGNASAGPWSYANQSGDEEAYSYIVWSNGLSTNTAHHIWDKTAPTAAITSSNGPPAPTSFSGTATDPNYGSGFISGSASCEAEFYDRTWDSYWSSGGSYSNAQFPVNVSCTISGMPSRSVTWSRTGLPPGYAHISHHCYDWSVHVFDGGHWSNWVTESFCIP
jgi:hypothetical protein